MASLFYTESFKNWLTSLKGIYFFFLVDSRSGRYRRFIPKKSD